MQRKASAEWKGSLKEGSGSVSSSSGVFSKTPFSFGTRFGDQPGTNPEQLIAAAHAGYFSMALSAQLGNAGMKQDRIKTNATITIEKLDSRCNINAIHLDYTGKVPEDEQAA